MPKKPSPKPDEATRTVLKKMKVPVKAYLGRDTTEIFTTQGTIIFTPNGPRFVTCDRAPVAGTNDHGHRLPRPDKEDLY